MPRIKEPIFLEDELDSKKTGVYIGYTRSELLAGPELKHNSSAKDLTKKFLGVAENIDGTAKKHDYQKKINTFGYAVLSSDCNNLVFGVKVTAPHGLNGLAKSAVDKHRQLLGFYLQQVGWKNFVKDEYGEYKVPLDNMENIDLLYNLSPSIGFYYKGKRPDIDLINRLRASVELNNAKTTHLPDIEKKY